MTPQPNTGTLGWLTIALAAEPEVIALIQSARKLFAKYPALTADQIAAMVQQQAGQAETEFDTVLAKIKADQPAA